MLKIFRGGSRSRNSGRRGHGIGKHISRLKETFDCPCMVYIVYHLKEVGKGEASPKVSTSSDTPPPKRNCLILLILQA